MVERQTSESVTARLDTLRTLCVDVRTSSVWVGQLNRAAGRVEQGGSCTSGGTRRGVDSPLRSLRPAQVLQAIEPDNWTVAGTLGNQRPSGR
jgi:hypothetical protein